MDEKQQEWWQTFPWGAVSIVLALVAIGVTVTIALWNKARKTLDYEILSDVLLLTKHTELISGIVEVTVKGKPVASPRVISIRYQNTGNKEIMSDEFLKTITLPAGVQVLQVTINESTGVVPQVAVSAKEDVQPSIAADCLNPGDYLDVQYLIDDVETPIVPTYRIRGATRPAKDMRKSRSRNFRVLAVTGWIIAVGVFAVAAVFASKGYGWPTILLLALGSLIPTVAAFWSTSRTAKEVAAAKAG
ncbi:hypothetical protein BS297_01040 [Rhodococcus erythropolis]|uniref:Uncharacterized protein n=1 Tax=Rhodococcus erythropolis TaxID=1833 RepID=A0A5N5EAB2_RHOER|nr:hypothetical protein BS297_01040 [Rhodococcus erythropolis]